MNILAINVFKFSGSAFGCELFDRESFDPESFDLESYNPVLTTERLTTEGLRVERLSRAGLTLLVEKTRTARIKGIVSSSGYKSVSLNGV